MSLLIIFIIAIILLQVVLFVKTGRLIYHLKKVLSGAFSTCTTVAEDVTVICYEADDMDKVSENIETSINTYLRKNKGAVSDFNLIKDIVERNCDTLEAEIISQTPLPLYLGLMGTVAGIILGLFTITLSGGFSNIEKVIEILMSDVAIAMVASFMGIGFTTLTLWKSKQCKVTVEANKNRFYTWIQTNLLPVISRSAVSAITLLQQNLTRFNDSFTGTVDRLEEKLGDVGDVYESQIEILEKIEAIDVKRMAMANVKVLAALDGSMASLDRFSQYMSNVTEYLTAVRELNGKLDEHLERTETLGVVSEFYKKQMKEIELRQDAIKSAVLSVDNVMKSAFATLQSNSEQGLRSMQEAFVGQMISMQEMISKQAEKLAIQMNQMPQVVQRLEEISAIPSKLDNLIDRIEKSNVNFAKQVSQSIQSIPTNIDREQILSAYNHTDSIPSETPWLKWSIIIAIVAIALACIANLTVNIISLKNDDGSKETIEIVPSVADDSISIPEIPENQANHSDSKHTEHITPEVSIDNNSMYNRPAKQDNVNKLNDNNQSVKGSNSNTNEKNKYTGI